jgi:hypothetical protein
MTTRPCESCGRPRGRGARCKECGYDRYATRLQGSRPGTSSQPAVTSDSSRPQARSSSRTAAPTATGGTEVSRAPHEPASSSPVREQQPAPRQAPGGGEPASNSRQSSGTSHTQPCAPVAAGRVVSLGATPPASGDRPWWVAVIHALAMLSAVTTLTFILALRTFAKNLGRAKESLVPSPLKLFVRPSAPRWNVSVTLSFEGLAALLGYRAGRYSQIRLRAPSSEMVCRYLAPPASIPVATGDDLRLWGKLGRDGVVRAYRLENLSNGASHNVTLIRSWVVAAAAISALFCLIVLAAVV